VPTATIDFGTHFIGAKLLSISSYITRKMYFFIVFSEVALRAAKSVKRDTVQFVFGTRSIFSPHFFNSQIVY
jgi:hypothetical protein